MIYKICPLSIWREVERQGSFSGVGIDRRDGYIHFSTAAQLQDTAARHFAGQDGLALPIELVEFGVQTDDPVMGCPISLAHRAFISL